METTVPRSLVAKSSTVVAVVVVVNKERNTRTSRRLLFRSR